MGGWFSTPVTSYGKDFCDPNDFQVKKCLRTTLKEGFWRTEDCVKIEHIEVGDTMFMQWQDNYYKNAYTPKQQYFDNKVVKTVSKEEDTIIFEDDFKITKYEIDPYPKAGSNGSYYHDCNGTVTDPNNQKNYSLKVLAIEKNNVKTPIGASIELIY